MSTPQFSTPPGLGEAALLGQIRGLIEQSMYNRVINNLYQWIDLFADKDTLKTPQSIRLSVPWGATHRSCLR